jgi:hypothetical protein
MNNYKTKYHRNTEGDVTIWNVFLQQWVRYRPTCVSDEVLASLSAAERKSIERRAVRLRKKTECDWGVSR